MSSLTESISLSCAGFRKHEIIDLSQAFAFYEAVAIESPLDEWNATASSGRDELSPETRAYKKCNREEVWRREEGVQTREQSAKIRRIPVPQSSSCPHMHRLSSHVGVSYAGEGICYACHARRFQH